MCLLPIGALNFRSALASHLDSKLGGQKAFLQAWVAPALRSWAIGVRPERGGGDGSQEQDNVEILIL